MREPKEVKIEDNLGEGPDPVIPFRYSITSYGADYTVDSLVKRMHSGDIYVPQFQRGYMWNLSRASRFIESLLLGLPVPGIFLSKEPDTNKLLVIDGQQRLRSLQYFYEGIFAETGREFALRGVQSGFSGLTYKKLKEEDRRRIDDSILHATVVRQDKPSDDQSSIYHIFQRINTGGLTLQPQEIRTCIYHGEFSEALKDLNNNSSWRSIYGPLSPRMRDRELILRFLALYFDTNNYKRPMTEFLNDYMGKNRHLKLQSLKEVKVTFENAIQIVFEHIGSTAFKPRRTLNAAVFDAAMHGIAKRLQKSSIKDGNSLKTLYRSLLEDETFTLACQKATADEENVKTRLRLAAEAFSKVK